MLDYMTRHWWVLTVRGALAVLFGVLAVFWPGAALAALAIVFGVYALAHGATAGYLAWQAPSGERAALVMEAVIGCVIGLLGIIMPLLVAGVLIVLFAVWAVLTGAVEIASAIRLRKEISDEWMYILGGALSICFGIAVLIVPDLVAFMIGFYAILFGAVFIVLSLRLRRMASA